MKRGDTWKHEAWLRRLLPAAQFQQIIYFEEAVLADNELHAKGYYIFLITHTHFYYLTSKDTQLPPQQSWTLLSLHTIQSLHDPATFFGDNPIKNDTRHTRIFVTDQVPSPAGKYMKLAHSNERTDNSMFTFLMYSLFLLCSCH